MGLLLPSRLAIFGIERGDVLIETGSDGGRSVKRCAGMFNTIHTIELEYSSYMRGCRRFRKMPHVHQHLGNSPEVLAKVIDPKRETLFWLDAHFVGGPGKVSEGPQCPLMDELRVIFGFTWAIQPTIIVDDARMYSGWYWKQRSVGSGYIREHWPKLSEIEELAFKNGFGVESIKGMLLIAKKGGDLSEQKA